MGPFRTLCLVLSLFTPLAALAGTGWDWKSPAPFQAYYSRGHGRPTRITLTSPYCTAGNPLYHPTPALADMWENDGWMLVMKDFGREEAAPRYPHLVMYNKYRGILRIALFIPDDLANTNAYVGEIRVWNPDADRPAPLFTFSAYPRCFANDFEPGATERSLNQSTMNDNWLSCDFAMTGYDPTLPSKDVTLEFTVFVLNRSQIELNSTGEFASHATEQTPVAAAGSLAGFERAYTSLQSGYAIYKTDQEALRAIQQGRSSSGPSWVTELVAGAAHLTGLGPIAAGLAGALSAYIGGGPGQATPMNFFGTLKFTTQGEIRNSHRLWSFPFRLADRHRGLAQEGIPYGLFNLGEKPSILDNITREGPRFRHTVTYLKPPRAAVNARVGYERVDLGVAFTFDGARPGTLAAPGSSGASTYFPIGADTCTFLSDTDQLPSGLALRMTGALPGPTTLAASPIEILKVYPIEAQPRLSAQLRCQERKRTGRLAEAKGLCLYRIQAQVTDPVGSGPYRYAWITPGYSRKPGSGLGRIAGGGPADDYIELLRTESDSYPVALTVRDGQDNQCAATLFLKPKPGER